MAHYNAQPGVIPPPQTRWIWKIFVYLLVITVVEVFAALPAVRDKFPAPWVFKLFLIGFTLLKAGLIVGAYMHLKDEVKNLILSVVLPFFLIIYLIVLMLIEGSYVSLYRTVIEQILIN